MSPRYERPRLVPWSDGKDPAPDVFAVTWTGEAVIVRHYRNGTTMAECCRVEGAITAADRRHVYGAEIGLLERLQLPCGYR